MASVEVKLPVAIYSKILYKSARSFIIILGLSKRNNKNLKLQKLWRDRRNSGAFANRNRMQFYRDDNFHKSSASSHTPWLRQRNSTWKHSHHTPMEKEKALRKWIYQRLIIILTESLLIWILPQIVSYCSLHGKFIFLSKPVHFYSYGFFLFYISRVKLLREIKTRKGIKFCW